MKFKTRLIIAFFIVTAIPMVLSFIAFLCIAVHMSSSSARDSVYFTPGRDVLHHGIRMNIDEIEDMFTTIFTSIHNDPSCTEDFDRLSEFNSAAEKCSSYILVRKNHSIYYTGNPGDAAMLFERLPAYKGYSGTSDEAIYLQTEKKYIRQIDFCFTDGSEGSLFIVMMMGSLMPARFVAYIFISLGVIFIFTGILVVKLLRDGVVAPIQQLGKAMQQVAEGNLDHAVDTNFGGELGELFKNYENMRLKLKESTQNAEINERAHTELISNISHDLKTPITSIKGYMEAVLDGIADTPEKLTKYIKIVYNKASDMDRLINELSFYSNIDTNRIPYNFQKINVSAYFLDCIDEIGVELESKNINLTYSNLLQDDTLIVADPEQLKRVIDNIIGNSIKFSDKPDPVIILRLLDELDSVRIEIEDNGCGISTRDLGNIFERFFRTDASRNTRHGGSGLGLSIAKKIIEDHGGYIWATSHEGEGTCIHFVLRKYREVSSYEQNIDY